MNFKSTQKDKKKIISTRVIWITHINWMWNEKNTHKQHPHTYFFVIRFLFNVYAMVTTHIYKEKISGVEKKIKKQHKKFEMKPHSYSIRRRRRVKYTLRSYTWNKWKTNNKRRSHHYIQLFQEKMAYNLMLSGWLRHASHKFDDFWSFGRSINETETEEAAVNYFNDIKTYV